MNQAVVLLKRLNSLYEAESFDANAERQANALVNALSDILGMSYYEIIHCDLKALALELGG